MKTILHVTWSSHMGGSEKLLLHTLKAFSAKNDNDFLHAICIMDGSGALLTHFQSLGLPIVFFHAKNGLDVKEMLKFVRFIRHNAYDIIHFHSIISTIALAGLFQGAKIIRSDHGGRLLNTTGWRLKRNQLNIRIVDFFIDKHIAVSHLVKERLEKTYGIRAFKVEVVHNSISPLPLINQKEELRNQLNIFNGEFVIGVVARLLPGKGIQYVVHALKQLLDQGISCKLVIVGDGPYREELETLSKQLYLEKNVLFTGLVSDASELFPMFDVFVFSSIWQESFGMTLLEAFAASIPTIAFNRGAVGEIITNHYNGYLIEPSSHLLSEKISDLYHNYSLRCDLGENGLQTIHTKFHMDIMLNRLVHVYHEVIRR